MKGEIRKYFLHGISEACSQKPIILFVDAVDEAGESSAKGILLDLQQLSSSLSGHSCQLGICLSCRHYPEIVLQSGKIIIMENFNHEDMARVAGMRVNRLPIFNDSEKQQLKADVLKKSGGGFQWTSLVIENIVQMRTQGHSFRAALKAIERVPTSLEYLYDALLTAEKQQCSLSERKFRRTLFHWVLFSARPLSPEELQHALALSQETKYSSIHGYETSPGFILAEDFETRIRSLSKGLIQIRRSADAGQVEFIHQSVVDFLTGRSGLRILSNNSDIDPIRLAHFELSRSCLRYLFMAELVEMLRTRLPEMRSLRDQDISTVKQSFPLISYAWSHWIFHVVSARNHDDESTKHNNEDILGVFQWPNDQTAINLWIPLRSLLGCPLESWQIAYRCDTPFVLDGTDCLVWGYSEFHNARYVRWPVDGSRLMHLFAICGLLDGSLQQRMISNVTSHQSRAARLSPLLNRALAHWNLGGLVPASLRLRLSLLYLRTSVAPPLLYAIAGQQKQVIRRLIAAKERLKYDGWNYWQSPIHLACVWGDVEVISLLISSGASSVYPDIVGNTPIHVAATFGQRGAINALIDAREKVNAETNGKYTPLHAACHNGQYETSKLLLEHGANPHAKDSKGQSVLFEAVCERQQECIELLLGHGARADEKVLSTAISTTSTETLGLLLKQCNNVNERGENRETALFAAVKTRDLKIVKILLVSGADVNAKNIKLKTPLHLAVSGTSIETVELLLEHGADLNIQDWLGDTALIIVMLYRRYEIGRLLLEAKADPNLKGYEGRTALMVAAAPPELGGYFAMVNRAADHDPTEKANAVRLLLQHGADPTARSLSGNTAQSTPKNEEIDGILRAAGCPLDCQGEGEVLALWKA